MKRVYKFLLMVACASMATSCLVDDSVDSENNDQGPNLVGFTSTANAANFTATGDEYPYSVDMEVVGPTYMDMTEDVTFSITVDPASTAIDGTHYTGLSTAPVTLTAGQNYIDNLGFTVLTAGITPPLDEAPVLILNMTEVTSAGNVVANGITSTIAITINYLCESDLAGTYYIAWADGSSTVFEVAQVSDGVYESEYFPTFTNWYWFEFQDVCGDLTITDWQYQGSNPIVNSSGGAVTGTVNADGSLSFTDVWVTGVTGYEAFNWTIYPY